MVGGYLRRQRARALAMQPIVIGAVRRDTEKNRVRVGGSRRCRRRRRLYGRRHRSDASSADYVKFVPTEKLKRSHFFACEC